MFIVTEPEFKDWKEHNVTKSFFKALFNDREILKEMLLAGTEVDDEVRGRARAIESIIRMSYEDLMESLTYKEEYGE